MDRAQAQASILQHAVTMQVASVLSHADAKQILGDVRFAKMMADDARNQPRSWGGFVYFWNVLDAAMSLEAGKVVYRLEQTVAADAVTG